MTPQLVEYFIFVVYFQGTNRTFHTAVNAGKYMAIFGGQSDKSYHGNTALVYNFKCNNWFQVNFTGEC